MKFPKQCAIETVLIIPIKRAVPRGRLPNAEYRTREYLTEREVERLMKAAGNNRHGHRDATMILPMADSSFLIPRSLDEKARNPNSEGLRDVS